MMRAGIILLFVLLFYGVSGQNSGFKRVLFLGNSYTNVNDLPGLTRIIATSMEDSLEYSSNTPGGYTLQLHSNDAMSLMYILMGNWDYVVLQEQSQIPSFPIAQVDTLCFPFARKLDSIIHVYNPCGKTMFYMTWGRKNGDASNCITWPPVCTYHGMDSLLRLRYRMMADSNNAVLSPVGAVWHYIRDHYPNIELYASDESHPSEAGTYAAACTFYTCIFRKDPINIPYNYTLDPITAGIIRLAAQKVAYDSLLYWKIGAYDPHADFIYTLHPDFLVEFVNTSLNASHFYWDFGDGSFSHFPVAWHQYSSAGNYNVKLVASSCNVFDSVTNVVNVLPVGINEPEFFSGGIQVYPNPSDNVLVVNGLKNTGTENILQIRNSLGKIVLEKQTLETNIHLNISNLALGVYELNIFRDDNNLLSRKFIKK